MRRSLPLPSSLLALQGQMQALLDGQSSRRSGHASELLAAAALQDYSDSQGSRPELALRQGRRMLRLQICLAFRPIHPFVEPVRSRPPPTGGYAHAWARAAIAARPPTPQFETQPPASQQPAEPTRQPQPGLTHSSRHDSRNLDTLVQAIAEQTEHISILTSCQTGAANPLDALLGSDDASGELSSELLGAWGAAMMEAFRRGFSLQPEVVTAAVRAH